MEVPKEISSNGKVFPIFKGAPEPEMILSPTVTLFGCKMYLFSPSS
jgi:hypothetical protein